MKLDIKKLTKKALRNDRIEAFPVLINSIERDVSSDRVDVNLIMFNGEEILFNPDEKYVIVKFKDIADEIELDR